MILASYAVPFISNKLSYNRGGVEQSNSKRRTQMFVSFSMWIRLIMTECNQGWQIVRVTYIHHILQRFDIRDIKALRLFLGLPAISLNFMFFGKCFLIQCLLIMVSSCPSDILFEGQFEKLAEFFENMILAKS